ncbi:MAG TPA: gliding motility-associated protein GldE [Bacteroidetes bacterium]|nr:gliding motility-associated protein GldE [Bacteroidota bacterium]
MAISVLLLLSAMFSASETAFFTLKTEELDELKNKNSVLSRSAVRLYELPDKLLSTLLILNTTTNVIFAVLSFSLCKSTGILESLPTLGSIVYLFAIIIVLLVFGEMLPKTYATRNNKSIVLTMALPLSLFMFLLRPVVSLVSWPLSIIKRKIGLFKPNIIDELSEVLEHTDEELNEDEKILKGVVNFSNINVNAIMCPRIDITAIDIADSLNEVVPVIIESGFSRIPVYSDTLDNIKGLLYAKDILPYMNERDGFKWQDLLRAPYFVPETKKINILLKELQIKKIHMAIVIDEYGGTSGIITLEDILEEIVGDITDESDEDEILYRKLDDNNYIFKGKILIDDIIEILNFDEDPFEFIRGESETLAGLILELTGEMPKVKQVVSFNNFKFFIEAADKRRITSVRMRVVEKDPEQDKEKEDIEKPK